MKHFVNVPNPIKDKIKKKLAENNSKPADSKKRTKKTRTLDFLSKITSKLAKDSREPKT